jgi:mono/diheme cytochrome c family protein
MRKILLTLIAALLLVSLVEAFHLDLYEPRVPPELLERLQDMDNPYLPTPERVDVGQLIYFGKGQCVTCHNVDGKGMERTGHAPRDFTDAKWQETRTDGELMWVLRNGSPGTEMPVRVGKVINEEEAWSVIHFIRTFNQSQ